MKPLKSTKSMKSFLFKPYKSSRVGPYVPQHGSPTVITNYFRFIDVIRVIKDVAMVDSDRVNACEGITSLANYYFKILHG